MILMRKGGSRVRFVSLRRLRIEGCLIVGAVKMRFQALMVTRLAVGKRTAGAAEVMTEEVEMP